MKIQFMHLEYLMNFETPCIAEAEHVVENDCGQKYFHNCADQLNNRPITMEIYISLTKHN